MGHNLFFDFFLSFCIHLCRQLAAFVRVTAETVMVLWNMLISLYMLLLIYNAAWWIDRYMLLILALNIGKVAVVIIVVVVS